MHKSVLGSKGRYFLLAAFFASFASAMILADSFRSYESETTALLLAKSDRAAALLRLTVENAEFLADTDTYRTRFFEELGDRSGAFDELSASSRREAFETMVEVVADDRGTVLRIRGYADDPDDAKEISRVATLSLFRFIGQYYNVKDDIDFRIAGAKATAPVIRDVPSFALSSVGLGVLSAAILFFALWALPRAFALFGGGTVSTRPVLDARVWEPMRPTSPYFDQTPRSEELVSFPEEEPTLVPPASEPSPMPIPEPAPIVMPVPEPSPAPEEPSAAHIRKASAPLNLPALSEAEEQFLREFSFEGSLEEEEVDEIREASRVEPVAPVAEAVISDEEPTEAEYKRRLNELIRG